MADALATLSLSPPSPFLPHPGKPAALWEQWKSSIETYLLSIGLDAVLMQPKTAILLHCLGAEGQRIFHMRGEADNYTTAMTMLDCHFEKKNISC